MLDLKFIVENSDIVNESLNNRGEKKINVDLIVSLDKDRKKLIQEVEMLKNMRNMSSKEIGIKKKSGKPVGDLFSELKRMNVKISEYDSSLKEVNDQLKSILLNIPNIPLKSVPLGKNEKDNKIVREWGEKKEFDFTPKPHWDIGDELKILDFKTSAKISGARFVVLMNDGAKLERSLINFMLDVQVDENNYTEVMPPLLVNENTMTGTGQLPKFKDDLFKCENFNLYLIPTGEVPLTNIYQDVMMNVNDLPKKLAAYTPCFRSEAGSYGKDVRGIIRQHQFNKIEMVKIVTPETGEEELENLLKDAEQILQQLNLHYRIIELCTGDLSFSSAKTYDLEVWMPGLNRFLEISSCSLCTDFQARRAKIRFKREVNSKPEFVHTLNGSGVAVGRTLAAVLETYQTSDGKINIPEKLQKYFQKKVIG